MRTKTMERKRYSLRRKKPVVNDAECQHVNEKNASDNVEEFKPENNISENLSQENTPKAKREETMKNELENEEPNEKKKRGSSEDVSNIDEKKVSVVKPIEEEKELTTLENENSNEDFPVYNALQHAVTCQLASDCSFSKCATAKELLLHYSSCVEGSENCTFCKEIDNMVCKHAQICEVPLDMCCTVPNCDKVRLMFLEEWVKLKHKHNEMMQNVFRGLIHAKHCHDKKCDLILCKNIKTVLYHTHYCKKEEGCKTKKFIIQLCKHHQETCTNDNCDVEFCQENVRRRKEDNEAALNIMQDSIDQNQSIVNTHTATSNTADFAPWYTNMFSNQIFNYSTRGTLYPQLNNIINESIGVESKQAFRELPDSQQGYVLQEDSQKPETSPNEEIYRTLWQSKDEYNRTILPKLSPNDLQSLFMARTDNQQILSPITDNRVTYSDVQNSSQQNGLSPSSQESELEENPLPLARYHMKQPLSINHFSQDRQRIRHCEEQQLKTQTEWGKIDFINRQFNHIEAEVTEESDSDGFSKNIDDNEDNMTAIEKSYIAGFKNKLFKLEEDFI